MTSGSSNSRSSTRPSSSASSVLSSESAAARRSASGRIALVHERADVSEQQRRRERGGLARLGSRAPGPGAGRCWSSARPARERRRRPAGIRGPSPARSGSRDICGPLPATGRRAGAGATAASGGPGAGGAAAAPGPRDSRNRDANSAEPPTSAVTIGSISSASKTKSSAPGGFSSPPEMPVSGSRTTMPSSEAVGFSSMP